MDSFSPTSRAGAGGTWSGYQPPAGGHDEALDAAGRTRPHWFALLGSLRNLGRAELSRRWADARHLIRENGVTYNVHGDPLGLERPWRLDPIPLLLPPSEVEALGEGLMQRARVLEALLADLYGPQRALTESLLPPELILANPAFLRPIHGTAPPGGRWLTLYAANVGRGPDGRFWVLGDRTQSPSGAGYVLENRIVLSRMLPEAFRDCRVQRLALFFRTLRDTLHAAAPHNRDNPRVVLLTPGPYNETYFEHAYLARYLGYTLVEGGDLTVRDGRVYLKVLGGLQAVDVILRRLDDDFCDPLELRPDSFLGVPGLVQAVRAGNVAVANALGSGVLETPALLAYLPALCRGLLGEEPLLPSVPTWWCGDPTSCSHVLAHLKTMVIKPAVPSGRLEPIFGETLASDELSRLADRIRARPRDFVGQQRLPLSTAPVLVNERVEARPTVLRAYVAAHADGHMIMPGGLTRVSDGAGTMVVSMQRGGGSKDTWVLSSGPVNAFTLLPGPGMPVELTRGGRDLPSRVADNLYWLGRYAERCEGLTRLLRGILLRLTERSGLGDVPELTTLLRALTYITECHPGFLGSGADQRIAAPEPELLGILHDTRRPGSLASILSDLRRVAGSVRDRISTDMWRALRDVTTIRRPVDTLDPGERATLSDELERLDRTVLTLAAFGGLASESMTRGEGWRFLDIGRKLERCICLTALVRHTLVTVSAQEGPLLEAILEIADSSMTYRRRYLGTLRAAAVLDLLLADETNPRSLAFQMASLAEDVDHLPRADSRPGRSPEQRLILSSLTSLRLAEVEALAQPDTRALRPALEELLGRLTGAMPILSDAITQTYLSHLQTSRHLAALDVLPVERP